MRDVVLGKVMKERPKVVDAHGRDLCGQVALSAPLHPDSEPVPVDSKGGAAHTFELPMAQKQLDCIGDR